MKVGILILAMILSVVKTAPPVPLQAPSIAAGASTENQGQAAKPPSAAGPNQPRATNRNTAQDGTKDTDHTIAISKLPPVAVSNPRRDWADWGTWLFTCLLAITSLLQIWLLWKTFRVASTQADIVKGQETQMIEAGKQTERIISQMKETAVRDLRAYIGVSRILLNLENMLLPEGLVEIQNFGKTPAYKVRHSTAIGIQTYPPSAPLPDIPRPERASVTVIFPEIKNVGKVALGKPLPRGVTIGTPELTVYVYGNISYEDAFGNQRYSNFRFIFGGTESAVSYRDERQKLCGAMRPDSEGNDAN
jgi:hypothetical protein